MDLTFHSKMDLERRGILHRKKLIERETERETLENKRASIHFPSNQCPRYHEIVFHPALIDTFSIPVQISVVL